MPFMKNAAGKIALAFEPEVEALKKAGWKLLNEAEEAAHRAELKADQELTSGAAQEEARVKAGVYDALGKAHEEAQDVAQQIEVAVKKGRKNAAK